jgi:putative heme-binding domain-containing protein
MPFVPLDQSICGGSANPLTLYSVGRPASCRRGGFLSFWRLQPAYKEPARMPRVLAVSLSLSCLISSAFAQQTEKPLQTTPHWIWLGQPAAGQTVHFRKEFQVRGRIWAAKLFATGDDAITVYLDGQQVLDSQGWEKPAFKDVTALFPASRSNERHVLAVQGRNSKSAAGVLVKLVLDNRQKEAATIVTDSTWRASEKAESGWQQRDFEDRAWAPAVSVGKLGDKPWTAVDELALAAAAKLKAPTATPISQLKIAKGFQVELLYSVPKDVEGSWVSMCTDPQGRLIVCDQYGGLFRVTPHPVGQEGETKVEKINLDIGEAQGLLWAFDSLYVMVNTGGKYASGLYRVRDSNGDGELDQVTQLRALEGRGEHGPHAVLLAPDGQSLYVVCGNGTKMTQLDSSRVPRLWGEDHLLPRMPDGRGFMKDVMGPGGCIYHSDPDGKHWELVSTGYRNEYDAAFNRHGDLFTYDADMEWDFNTPWYRPTRVCQAVSGSEFGWRNGAGKMPPYYADSVPPTVEIGPGSPTGVCFGYGAKFPARYQEAFFICDWSYGKLYAVHLEPSGAAYTGKFEEFITGTPLPLTDLVVNPHDGAMYFAIGGRKVQSGLYRVTYAGSESTVPLKAAAPLNELHILRRRLEAFHGRQDAKALSVAWPHLSHADRFIRYAARVAVEHQDPTLWRDKALAETNPQAALEALLALVRATSVCPLHRKGTPGVADPVLKSNILASLERIDFARLGYTQKLEMLRIYAVLFNRMGPPEAATRDRTIARFDPHYPAAGRELNADLCQLLVYLQAPSAAAKSVALLQKAPTQEEQIEYARSLRMLTAGWTPALRETYFSWFLKAAGYKGGASFSLFVQNIKNDALARLTDEQKVALKPILDAQPATTSVTVAPPRPFVKKWTMEELLPLVENGLTGRDFDRGRALFGAANCFACHRFDNEGGAMGPDLSGLAGRFNPRDLLESIVQPSKVISDQYAAVTIVTTDGRVINGRIVNLAGDTFKVNTNMLDPDAQTNIDRNLVEEMLPSKLSMMPEGLLDTLKRDEALDLFAYLLSRGDRNHPAFAKGAE